MAKQNINVYSVTFRLSETRDDKRTININACSRVGAMYQALLFLKQNNVKDIFALKVKNVNYPLEKRKRRKYLKQINQTKTKRINNLEAVEHIKTFLDKQPPKCNT